MKTRVSFTLMIFLCVQADAMENLQKSPPTQKEAKWSYARTAQVNNKCKECHYYDCRTATSTILHLINEHKAKIVQSFVKDVVDKNNITRPHFEIIYQVPKENNSADVN